MDVAVVLLLLLWLLLIRDRINCRWRWLAQNHEGVTNDLTHPEVLRVKFNGNHDDDCDIVARPLICLAQEICVWKSKVFPWTNIIKMHQIPCLPACWASSAAAAVIPPDNIIPDAQ